MTVIHRLFFTIFEINIDRKVAVFCACKKVFKNLVAEADRQSHCSRYEATEQSLEQ